MKRIYITGEIGFEVQPHVFRASLADAKGKDIEIVVASPGGYVYEGLEIYNAIRDYKRDNPKSKIVITLKGLAASMASYISANPAADLVMAEDNAVFMIHRSWSGAVGNAGDMEKTAATLRGLDQLVSQAYAARTGKSQEEMLALMDAETWYFGSEIKEAGFVDEIIGAEDKDAGKDKAAALAAGRTAFAAVAAKMKRIGDRAREDIDRAAAMIGGLESTYRTPTVEEIHAVAAIETLDELKAANRPLFDRVMIVAQQQAAEALASKTELQRVPGLIKLKRELRDSPLYEGISDILEEAMTGNRSLIETLTAICKWTASGSAVAALESEEIGPINTGHVLTGSGETQTLPREKKPDWQ